MTIIWQAQASKKSHSWEISNNLLIQLCLFEGESEIAFDFNNLNHFFKNNRFKY